MNPPDASDDLREKLTALLDDADGVDGGLVSRLDNISDEHGEPAHAALLGLLTQLTFDDGEARRHLRAIVADHAELRESLGRSVGLRVATLDYFMNLDRRLVQPTLIESDALHDDVGDRAVDPLSGLVNASTFRAAAHLELRRARRYGQRMSLLLMDLDDFASANEEFGPLVGDRILQDAARLLVNVSRDIDVCARPGEDEFALILPETDRDGARLVAERFREELLGLFSRFRLDGRAVRITVSIGIASFPDDAMTSSQLLARAAEALYEAKAMGKNRVRCFRPERRNSARTELNPGRVEVEVLGPSGTVRCLPRNLSRGGMMLSSSEPLALGEQVEMRLATSAVTDLNTGPRLSGRVVRLEVGETDRFEIGIAFDAEPAGMPPEALDFLNRARSRSSDPTP